MKKILILGAGKSSGVLIQYLSKNAEKEGWQLLIGDINPGAVKQRLGDLPHTEYRKIDLSNDAVLGSLIVEADIVVSMLPAAMHPKVADACVHLGKNMVTASYISDEMKALDEAAKAKGVLLLNEIGVDPGIDHMSAMQVIHRLKEQGAEITGFESFTGGLLAHESETKDNPWQYKFTWNPRNVVLAGQGTVKFIQMGKYKYIPYHKLFRRTETIKVPEYGRFEGYANRDSLKYREVYGLGDIDTMYRGTLRRPGFCKAWNIFVQLGATDDTYVLPNSEEMTYREFLNTFLAYNPHDSVELKLAHYLNLELDGPEMDRLKWLDLFSDKKLGLKNATPAQALQHILEQKWALDADDRDMIVMWHRFNYTLNGEDKQLNSSMVVTGDDTIATGMAKTVGLPVGIAVKHVLKGTIKDSGVKLPVEPHLYEPVMNELKDYGVVFYEEEVEPEYY